MISNIAKNPILNIAGIGYWIARDQQKKKRKKEAEIELELEAEFASHRDELIGYLKNTTYNFIVKPTHNFGSLSNSDGRFKTKNLQKYRSVKGILVPFGFVEIKESRPMWLK